MILMKFDNLRMEKLINIKINLIFFKKNKFMNNNKSIKNYNKLKN